MVALLTVQSSRGKPTQPCDVFELLNDWNRWADTLRPEPEQTGYDIEIGRTGVAQEAGFVALAARYGELNRHLGYQPADQNKAVVLYFRGEMDTDPKSRTYGMYFKRNEAQVGLRLKRAKAVAGALIFNGVRDLVATMCRTHYQDAKFETSAWWKDRNYGFNKVRN